MVNLPKMLMAFSLLGLLVFSMVFVYGLSFCGAQTGTGVKGIISVDSTWRRSGGPYNLTGNLAVDQGVKLTVEPGVVVNLNGFYIRVNGTFVARGIAQEYIHLNGGSISFTSLSVDWDSRTDSGSVIEYAVVSSYIGLGSSSPLISRNTITVPFGAGSGSPLISKNTIAIDTPSDWIGRPSYRSVALSVSGDALILDNMISGDLDNTAFSIDDGSPVLERNLISNRYGFGGSTGYGQSGITVSGDATPIIKLNTIRNCANGITIADSSKPLIENNNIEGITNYNLRMYSRSVNIEVANNWWGTADSGIIEQKIYDFQDDFDLGKVSYTPFLTSENQLALPNLDAALTTPIKPSPTLTPTPSASATPSVSQSTAAPTSSPNAQLSPSPFPTVAEEKTPADPTLTIFTIVAVFAVVAAFFLGRRLGLRKASAIGGSTKQVGRFAFLVSSVGTSFR